MDELYGDIAFKIKTQFGWDITSDNRKKDKFLEIAQNVGNEFVKLNPQPSLDEYKQRVKKDTIEAFSIDDIEDVPSFYNTDITPSKDMDKRKSDKGTYNQGSKPTNQLNKDGKKVLIIDTGESTDRTTFGVTETGTANELTSFRVSLIDDFLVPGENSCEVYLDNITISGAKAGSHTGDSQSLQTNEQFFIVGIDEFNIQARSNNTNINTGKIIISNSNPQGHTKTGRSNVVVHKSKKYNYICELPANTTFTTLGITCTLADGSTTIFSSASETKNRIVMEFVFIPM